MASSVERLHGQGTDHPGIGKCKFHGGSTSSHRTHAIVAQAKTRAARLGEAYEMEPVEALLWMVNLSAGQVRYLGEELASARRQPHERGKPDLSKVVERREGPPGQNG